MEWRTVTDGGMQSVPQLAVKQLIYLDFDGELTQYRNEDLELFVSNVQVADSGLTAERIAQIVTALNEQFADCNVEFVTERPENEAYSTVYVGKTSGFEPYGTFAGLAETVDSGNQIKNDNAFVILDSTSDNAQIVATIAHETEHLIGTLDHGGEGLQKYAARRYDVSSGVTSTGIILTSGDSMYVSGGGAANRTTVRQDAELYVLNDGMATSTTVSGYLCLSSGTATSTTLNGDASFAVYGGTANRTDIVGGYMWVYGMTNDTTINGSSGDLRVYSGGVLNNTVINSGFMGLCGGSADNTSVNSGRMTIWSGTANNTTVNSGGSLEVSKTGVASNTILNSNGKMIVSSGGTALAVRENGGYVSAMDNTSVTFVANSFSDLELTSRQSATVHSGTTASHTTLISGACLFVYDGGIAADTSINGMSYFGYLNVSGGGAATDVKVNSNGVMNVFSGGTAADVKVNAGGTLKVSSGGGASGIEVNANGSMYVDYQASATAIKENGGYVSAHSQPSAMTFVANSFSDLELTSRQSATVHSGTTAIRTAVNSSSLLEIGSGGTALDVKENGGYVDVAAGANVTFVANSFTDLILSSGQSATTHSGTTAMVTTVKSGGALHVFAGGTATGATIESSGLLTVSSGGVATGINAASGAKLNFYVAPDTYVEGQSAGAAFAMQNAVLTDFIAN